MIVSRWPLARFRRRAIAECGWSMKSSYPPGRISAILPAGYRKSLDTMKGQAYVPIVVWNRCSRQGFTLTTSILEQHMGSTTFGNANPATVIGLAMPQDIRINRDGCGRVRVVGRV